MLNDLKPIGTVIKKLIKPRAPFENESVEKICSQSLLRIDYGCNDKLLLKEHYDLGKY